MRFNNTIFITLFSLFFLLLQSCKEEEKWNISIPENNVELEVYRLDSAIFNVDDTVLMQSVNNIYNELSSFADIYFKGIIRVGDTTMPSFYNSLIMFKNDNDMRQSYKDAYAVYQDFNSYKKSLTNAFKLYKFYFPNKHIPKIVPCITGYNYAILAADSILGISLEMFMGKNYKYYALIGFPLYKAQIMDSTHLVTEAVKSWVQTEFFQESENEDLLTKMINAGKIYFITEALLPTTEDYLIMGYTPEQWKWCEENRVNMWAHWVDKQLLYSTNSKDIIKYLNEGPFTPGFPRESPARTAAWMGWMIVKAYMQQQNIIDLNDLINTDAKTILKKSKFKP
ncbi:MAG: hypothetical protein ACK4IK_10205 [Bacteroidia bacterium]